MSAQSQCWGAHAARVPVSAAGRDASQESTPALDVPATYRGFRRAARDSTPAACAPQADALQRVS
jgi:hypothetical protein